MSKLVRTSASGAGALSTLTSRELEVLALIGQGKRIAEIARQLHRSVHTIKSHRAALSKKLNISDRVGLARYSIHSGLVALAGELEAADETERVADCMRLCYSAFHSVPIGSVFCSADTTVRHINVAAREMLGIHADSIIGAKLTDAVDPLLAGLADTVHRVGTGQSDCVRPTLEVTLADERTLTAEVSALDTGTGPDATVLVSLRDATAQTSEAQALRKRLAELEAQAQQAASEYTSTLGMLRDEMVQRQRVDSRLKEVLAGTGASSGEGFFRLLVRSLARSLGVSHAFVVERVVAPGSEPRLHVVAAWSDDRPVDVADFPIIEGPCVVTLRGGQCHIPASVGQLFPNSGLLKQVAAESYLGIPLASTAGDHLGVLCVLDRNPLPDASEALPVLRVFASRAAAELQRLNSEALLSETLHAARRNEERYRAIVDSQADFLSRSLPDSTLTFVNQSLCEAYRSTPEQLIGRQWLSMVHESERSTSLAMLAGLTPQNPAAWGVNRLRLDSGLRLVEWLNRGVFDKSGICIEVQGVGRDVTDRVLAELAMGTCPGVLSPDGRSIDIGLFLTDAELMRPVVNAPLTRILGVAHQKLHDDLWHDTIHPQDRERILGEWRASTRALQCFNANFRIVRPDGAAVPVRCFAAPHFDKHGQLSGYLGSVAIASQERG